MHSCSLCTVDIDIWVKHFSKTRVIISEQSQTSAGFFASGCNMFFKNCNWFIILTAKITSNSE